jgi:polysaccharide export outer membrane protein
MKYSCNVPRIALLVLALAIAASAGDTKKSTAPIKPLAPSGQPVLSATQDPSYIIGPEDVITISVWKEADVSGTVPVRPDGKISLPLLNDVQAAGLTPMQLAAQITEKLKQFVAQPQVTVTVNSINSRRIYIVGQVGRAGAFPLVPEMTVLQAISSAGGISEFADSRKIYVLRNENGKPTKYFFNYKEVLRGENSQQNIALRPGDTIVVP